MFQSTCQANGVWNAQPNCVGELVTKPKPILADVLLTISFPCAFTARCYCYPIFSVSLSLPPSFIHPLSPSPSLPPSFSLFPISPSPSFPLRLSLSLPLRYINCRNAHSKLNQLCRSVLRAVFDVFHFVSASLVHGVSFSFVLHGRSQIWVKTWWKSHQPSKIFPRSFLTELIHQTWCEHQSKQFLWGSVSGFSTFSLVLEVQGVQLRLPHSNAPNQKSTSPSHSCGEQHRSKPS